jgi:hypothetical protein
MSRLASPWPHRQIFSKFVPSRRRIRAKPMRRMNATVDLEDKKGKEWRAHCDELVSASEGNSSIGGARCQSRFLSSRTAVPLFREEAKDVCCSADRGRPIEREGDVGTAMWHTVGAGRRCGDKKQDGEWRYCFADMQWKLEERAEERACGKEERGTPGAGSMGKRDVADEARLRARIAQLEEVLGQHHVAIPPWHE